ncbi:cytochrome P450 [Streptomyces resistomycificus]|uniref:cytochrome P450 n=1 Tax=Streptomyces resistomycificus TaxID=67356 RepID=UPI001CEC7DFA|nr:cytochrome P450 [Streptomyces resistomycificus]
MEPLPAPARPRPLPRPLTFDPDHWEPGRAAGTRGSFLAFGDGRRECIGENFAGAELQITLATGLRT